MTPADDFLNAIEEAVAAMVARHDALREEVRRDQARQARREARGANVVSLRNEATR